MRVLKEKNKQQLALAGDVATSRILGKILDYAVAESVDELIFESAPKGGAVKFYDAGEKKGKLNFSSEVKDLIFGAIKDLAGLSGKKDGERGQFKKEALGGKIVFSVSRYSSRQSEKIIITLARDKFEIFDLGQLGFEKNYLSRVKDFLAKGKGLVLIQGPFNSGKTTTLYSFVNYVNRPDLNITTFENEISADMPAVNQSRLGDNPGLRYPLSLSSILRQDPDVVMIDEMTDKDAVEAALHLADRGYLVLAGIYSKDTASTLDFLQGLGVSLPLFADTVKMVVNQRLVARNCPRCLEKINLGREMAGRLKSFFGRADFLTQLKAKKLISAGVKGIEDIVFYQGRGCDACRRKGLDGRIGVFEVLEMNQDIKKLIKGGHFLSVNNQVSRQEGFSLSESAFIKAAAGLIPPSEALRLAEERLL